MKYLSKFENFSVNESNEKEYKKSAEELIRDKVKSISESEKEKIRKELLTLANKLGLSSEDLKDEEKVRIALSENIEIKEGISEFFNFEKIKKSLSKLKDKLSEKLFKIGFTGVLLGLVTAAVGTGLEVERMPDYMSVVPNETVLIGGVASAVSLIASLIGLYGMNTADTKNKK
jgi:hypothetical protein